VPRVRVCVERERESPSVLYLTHRAGLLPSFHIRHAEEEDLPACRGCVCALRGSQGAVRVR
jgi:hypothetical protein